MYDDLGIQAQQKAMPAQPTRFTLTERLEAEQRTLKDRLAQIEKLLEALKANPGFQELFDLISKYM
jgi:hypothetical protein